MKVGREGDRRECCVVGEGETVSLSFAELLKCSLALHLSFVYFVRFSSVNTPLLHQYAATAYSPEYTDLRGETGS